MGLGGKGIQMAEEAALIGATGGKPLEMRGIGEMSFRRLKKVAVCPI